MNVEDMTDALDLGELVAVVHSHPDATSQPSAYDMAFMQRRFAVEKSLDPEATPTPWWIVSWPEGDFREVIADAEIPLLGRTFVHGFHDCWQFCNDYYAKQYGITFPEIQRKDRWWEDKDGPSLYEETFLDFGFYRVELEDILPGDMVVMQIGRSYHPNHAAIYLGSQPSLPDTQLNIFGHGPFIAHHMYGRKSAVEIYGGQWLERTRLILRHRDAHE
ncbi:NlpC/P60 family protein [compost metagenome]